MEKGTIKGALITGAIEGFIIEILHGFKGAAISAGTDLVKAHAGGRGVHDESLFNDACAYAVSQMGVTKTELAKVIGVINSLSTSERRRVIEIIGQKDTEVKIPKVDAAGFAVTTKKGDVVYTTQTANVRGAATIALLSSMSPSEITDYLRASNSFDTIPNRMKAILASPQAKNIAKGLVDFDNDTKSYFKKKTPLELLAERMSGKSTR